MNIQTTTSTNSGASLNYADILRDLQAQAPVAGSEPVVQPPEPTPPPPTATPAPPPPTPSSVETVPIVPAAIANKTEPVNKALDRQSEGILVRYRRYIFVAIVAFLVVTYGMPMLNSIEFLASNSMYTGLVAGLAIAVVYYVGDVFLLMPEMTVTNSQ